MIFFYGNKKQIDDFIDMNDLFVNIFLKGIQTNLDA
jgi:hypothetical protein